MVSKTLQRRQGSRSTRSSVRDHIERVLHREIQFVANAEFSDPSADAKYAGDEQILPRRLREIESAPATEELPPHLARLCLTTLLTPAEEGALFRRLNFLKFRANSLRSRLDPEDLRTGRRMVAKIEATLEEAQAIRDHLVHSNMRLVISIVRKHVTPQFTFDELLSEGLAALIQATEKFDYDRGFRFSTYAFRVVSRGLFRHMQTRRRDAGRFVTCSDDASLHELEGGAGGEVQDDAVADLRMKLTEMVNSLDPREGFIIRCRYALGAHRRSHTLQHIAHKLGVSKERVRQIERRALVKLQTLAEGMLEDSPLLFELFSI